MIRPTLRKILLLLAILFQKTALAEESPFYSADQIIKLSDQILLSEDDEWRSLLHFNGDTSSIDDDYFFLTKTGNKNPKQELDKTIEEITKINADMGDSNIQCRYPARLELIVRKLNLDPKKLSKPSCKELDNYLTNTSPKEISIVFASENVNNLMSMMGHIFLKISGEKNGQNVEHALGYFANFSQQNPIRFIYNALFSGTSGAYLLEPYKKKLYWYNIEQKRSLWEFKLNLSEDQVKRLTLHIWEMKRANAKYNFVTHNCGSALMYLIYVVEPNLKKLQSNTDAPIDLIKNLQEYGLIQDAELSPSDGYKFRMLSHNLTVSDRNKILDFIENESTDYLADSNKKNLLIEAAKTATDYKFNNNKISLEKYERLLSKLNYIDTKQNINNLTKTRNPLSKSKSSKITLGYKNQSNRLDNLNFGYYPVYNSINDNNSGYFNEFELQLANIEGGYYLDKEKIMIDNFDLIKMKNFVPFDSIVDGISGSFRVNAERERFDTKTNKMFPNLNIGGGLARNLLDERIMIYGTIGGGYSYFSGNDVAYLNPEAGLILKNGNFGKTYLKYSKFNSSNPYKYKRIKSIDQTVFISQNDSIKISYSATESDIEKSLKSASISYCKHF